MIDDNEKLSIDKIVREILDQGESFNEVEEELLHDLIYNKISKDSAVIQKETFTFGDRMADAIASSVGSWKFIIIALTSIAIWVGVNTISKGLFDPFPFILLNLVLSCTAAIQAPVIMMSQNRQEEKDRIKSKNDYKINLKSELIIEDLHKKLDLLIENQNQMMDDIEQLKKSNF